MIALTNISKKFLQFSFRSWVVIVSAIVFSISGLIVWLYLPQKVQEQMLSAAHDEAQLVTGTIASTVAPALYFNDSDALNEAIQSALSNFKLRYIVITDQSSRVVASQNIDKAIQLDYLSTNLDGKLSIDGRTQLCKSSITLNNHSLGEIYIGFSLEDILAQVNETKETTLLTSVFIALIGMGAMYAFCNTTTRSLNKLTLAFQNAENGNFPKRAEGSSIEEIDRCIASFNRLVSLIQTNDEKSKGSIAMLETHLTQQGKDLQAELQHSKEIEFALQENERRYRTLIDYTSDGIALYADDKFVFVNPALTAILRAKSAAEITGRSLFDFVPQEKREDFRGRVVSVLYGTEQQLLDKFALQRSDNSIAYVELSIIRLVFHSKPSLQILVRDLSAKIQTEAPKTITERAEIRTQTADDFGVLASGIAHDFASILSIIVTGVNKLLFLGEVNKGTVVSVAEHITKAANRGNALVKQLAAFAKRSEVKLESIQVNAVILEIGKTLQQTFPQSISFDFRLSANVNPVMADGTQLHQVIVHLCRMARNAMPFGGTLIISTENVSMVSLLQKGIAFRGTEAVCIKVHASGNIIKEELQRRIFEPVFHKKEKSAIPQTGLEMVYSIMQNHNGFLDVDARSNEGTMYSLYFPATEEQTVLKN